MYLVGGSLFSNIAQGSTINISQSDNYITRFDGNAASIFLASPIWGPATDVNDDDTPDFLMSVDTVDNESRNNSGSMWVVFNFPHAITTTSGDRGGSTATVKGTISATNSVTTSSGVQYQVDSNSASSRWNSTGCTADDGAFDETSE